MTTLCLAFRPRSCSLPEASIQFKAIGKSCSGKVATCMASYDLWEFECRAHWCKTPSSTFHGHSDLETAHDCYLAKNLEKRPEYIRNNRCDFMMPWRCCAEKAISYCFKLFSMPRSGSADFQP